MAAFGNYRLLAQLAGGGTSEVFVASEAGGRSSHPVLRVIKRLRATGDVDAERLDRLGVEVRALAASPHRHILRPLEIGRLEGRPYLVIEYVDGQPLDRIQNLSRARRRSAPLTKQMQYVALVDALAGIHHFHEVAAARKTSAELAFGGITPKSVFVSYSGEAKVLRPKIDLAREAGAPSTSGAVRYRAPEELDGDRVDRRSDVFAVGAVLWESAAGARRWREKSDAGVLRAMRTEGWYTPLRAIDPSVPEALDTICRRALAPDPDRRYSSAEEFRRALAEHLASSGDVLEVRAALAGAVSELCNASRDALRRVIDGRLGQDTPEARSFLPAWIRGQRPNPKRGA